MTRAGERKRILIAEPDPSISEALREFLEHVGYDAEVADNQEDIVAVIKKGGTGVVIIDFLLNATGDGDLLGNIHAIDPTVCAVMLLSFPLAEYVVSAFRKGAFDVVIKPVDLFELDEIAKRAFKRYELNKAYHFVSQNLEKINELARRGVLVTQELLSDPVS
ncbi:MAG: response regulator [Candidatus Zixiibacteriota bacterium]|nr:MAG: response regulator [candidate division Zixibacteria bacterium]